MLQVLLAAMQSQLLGDSRVANTLIPRVCNAVLAAPSSTRHVSQLPAALPLAAYHALRWPADLFSCHPVSHPARLGSVSTFPCGLLASAPLQLLVKWWAEYPAELLENRVVKPLQKYLTDELYATKKLTIRCVAQGSLGQGFWGWGCGAGAAGRGRRGYGAGRMLRARGPAAPSRQMAGTGWARCC